MFMLFFSLFLFLLLGEEFVILWRKFREVEFSVLVVLLFLFVIWMWFFWEFV